ncbi:MAG TPA: hypothetical protein VML91_19200 [Burkholderiales bacterium]|nr:hypothetical protein [Burkholderiales bacterium]
MPKHHTLLPAPETVHRGHFDAKIPPRPTVDPGDTVVDDDEGIHAMAARNLVD